MPLSNDHLLEFSNTTFLFSAATALEEVLIKALKAFISRLKTRDVFTAELGDIVVNAVYNKEMSRAHQISLNVIPKAILPLHPGNVEGRKEDVGGETWVEFSGKCNYSLQIICRSMQRSSVAKIADIVMIGLMYPINIELQQAQLYLPLHNLGFTGIVPERDPGYESIFRTIIEIPEFYVGWKQMYREDGKLAVEVDAEISIQ